MGKIVPLVTLLVSLAVGSTASAAPSPRPVPEPSASAATDGAAPPVHLALHKAVYDLSLARAERGGIVAFAGSLTFRVDAACTGWTNSVHLDVMVRNSQGLETNNVMEYSAWESFDGNDLSFYSRLLSNDRVQEITEGSVRRDAKPKAGVQPIIARFVKPEAEDVVVAAGALFPNAYTRGVVQAGLEGRPFMSASLFDGSVPGAGSLVATALTPVTSDPSAKRLDSPLLKTRGWMVSMAYFLSGDEGADGSSGDGVSSHELRGVLHENGVISDMVLDYGSFSVNAKLKSLEALPQPDCGG
ncbi:DUF1849 family protein [Phaeovibrio sulfidiphilus]|uniref:DUF1849 family protein n=1 Tax=Phaeovibrio sulfidiphilus TaxID=1220600 RepID=A0A8J7CCW8_9PROT|nr:DUF1849 family protein [Phaeovibrio sulfidiphilus]MBE1236259.1 DUF1849 family protein [Phaeovibrio sulfidiphilus]